MPKRMKAAPTIVYEYGCKPPDIEARVIDQMRLAHRYRNTLCEIELWRRGEAAKIIHIDELEALRQAAESLDASVKQIYDDRAKRNAGKRRKTAFTAEEKASLETLRPQLRDVRREYVARKKTAFADMGNRAALAAIDAEANEKVKAARAAIRAVGLYWGSYALIEQAAQKFRQGAPPRFRGFRGEGQIAVQVQTTLETRLTSEKIAVTGGDTHFAIEMEDDERHAKVGILVGGDNPCLPISRNNPHVYATVRAVIHRPLPPGCYVSWVRLCRRKIGTHFKWRLQFTLANPAGWSKPLADGTIGLDDRFEPLADGSMRIARWEGSDGDGGELRLPAELLAALRHKAPIQAIHDRHTEAAKSELIGWVKSQAEEFAWPDWWTETTKTLGLWRGAARLCGLIGKWRQNRFAGDAEIFGRMEACRKKARHLFDWLSHERTRALGRRLHLYRNFAADLAKKYGTAGVRKFTAAAILGEDARFAARSTLREILRQRGLRLVELPAGEGDDSVAEILREVQCQKNTPEPSLVTA